MREGERESTLELEDAKNRRDYLSRFNGGNIDSSVNWKETSVSFCNQQMARSQCLSH